MPLRELILYQFVFALVFVLCFEGVSRIGFTVYAGHTPGAQRELGWFSFTPDLGWDRRPNFNGRDLCGAPRAFDSRGLVSIDAAQLHNTGPENRRVLFLGDSNTYGYCLETETTFVEVAERLLPQFSMINLGVNGYTSFQGYKTLLKYGSIVKPSVVVISFNFNDRRSALGEQPDSDAVFRQLVGWQARARAALAHSYSIRAMILLSEKLGLIKPRVADVRLDKLIPRVDERSYRDNLIKMVRWTRQHGGVPIFILLRDNPQDAELLRQGIRYLSDKNYEAAIKYLTMVTKHPHSALVELASLYLSRAYRELGQVDKAEQVLWMKGVNRLTALHGGRVIRLDTDYNKIMMDVSREYDVLLVDAVRELEKNPRVFFDVAHFDVEGHEIVGSLLKDALAKVKGPVPP